MAPFEDNPEYPFEASLRAGFQALAQERGACLEEATLEQLATGELPPREADEARRHIARCGLCDLRLTNLMSLAVTETTMAGEVRENPRPPAAVPVGPPKPRHSRGTWGLIWHPAFAYAVAALVLVVATVRDLRHGSQPKIQGSAEEATAVAKQSSPVAQTPAAAESVAAVTLDRERGPATGIPTVTGHGRSFELTFWVRVTIGHEYEAVISGTSPGAPVTVVPLTDLDALGNAQLVCQRQRFPSGVYELRVRDVAAPNAAPLHFYRFRVQ